MRRMSQSNTGREVLEARRSEGLRYSRISRYNEARRSARVENRLLAGNIGLQLMVLFGPRFDDVPTQPGVQGKTAADTPVILTEEAEVVISKIERLTRRLGEIARSAK